MSAVKIRAAMEVALDAMTPAIDTAWENAAFAPRGTVDAGHRIEGIPYAQGDGTPYQQVHILFAQPDNETFGSAHVERGFMQVALKYPLMAGTAAVTARAELLRSTFYRGQSFSSGGVTVIIEKTPEIGSGSVDGDRFVVIVKIRFFANIN